MIQLNHFDCVFLPLVDDPHDVHLSSPDHLNQYDRMPFEDESLDELTTGRERRKKKSTILLLSYDLPSSLPEMVAI